MNANRMKYASTPTYGMQKRGLFNKKQQNQKEPSTPDFSQAPENPAAFLPQQFFSVPPQSGFPQPSFTQTNNPYPPSPYFSPNLSIPPMQQTAQIPFAAPNFVQSPAQYHQMAPQRVPMQPQAQTAFPAQPPPLGNSVPIINTANAGNFSPRAQGYIPPPAFQPQQMPVQPAAVNIAPRPAVQTAPFLGGFNQGAPMYAPGMPTANPMGQPGYQQPGMSFQPSAVQLPISPFPSIQPLPTGSGGMQPPSFTAQKPAPKNPSQPMDANKIWSIFLFGLLPLLFLPCIFVPGSLNVLRYLFLAFCVCGLGAMWYRQMFTSTTRLVVSVAYVALCIVTIALMSGAGRDVQTGSNLGVPPNAQTTQSPDGGNPAAAAPSSEPQPSDTPSPTIFGPSAAEQRLTDFMNLWRGNNTPEMVSYVQPSWAGAQDNPSSQLFIVLGNRTPEEFTIEDVSGTDEDSSRTVTMTATINKNNGKEPSIYRFMVLMVKESGEWYVDPNSLATNDEVKADDTVVNDAGSSGLATPPPRTTVTPVPPGSTTLYYNPDGGSFYHADPECPNVKKEYLPLAGSFLYSELSSDSYKKLQPCLKCGAPTQALPDENQ